MNIGHAVQPAINLELQILNLEPGVSRGEKLHRKSWVQQSCQHKAGIEKGTSLFPTDAMMHTGIGIFFFRAGGPLAHPIQVCALEIDLAQVSVSAAKPPKNSLPVHCVRCCLDVRRLCSSCSDVSVDLDEILFQYMFPAGDSNRRNPIWFTSGPRDFLCAPEISTARLCTIFVMCFR